MEFTSNELGYTLAKLLFGEKILVSGTINNAKVIRLEPPAVISYEQLDIVLAAIEKHINVLAKQQEELAVN